MSRSRFTIGTFGTIGFQTASNGRVTGRARYRAWDGELWLVQAPGDTKRATEQRLKVDAERSFRTKAEEARATAVEQQCRLGMEKS